MVLSFNDYVRMEGVATLHQLRDTVLNIYIFRFISQNIYLYFFVMYIINFNKYQ